MYTPVTAKFLKAIANSSRVVTQADIYISGSLAMSGVPVIGGSVTADSTANIRRSAQIQIVNPDRVGADGSISPLASVTAPGKVTNMDLLRAEFVIRHGFEYDNGVIELVPMGRFMVWSADVDLTKGDTLDVELYDRGKYLELTDILKVQDFSGVMATVAIQTLLNSSLPQAQTLVVSANIVDVKLPGGSTYDNDTLDAVLSICDIIGAEFYFDLSGVPVLQPKKTIDATTTSSASKYTFQTGDSGTLVELSRALTREGVSNGVGVYGAQVDGTTAQPYGEAFDLDPSSRTYWQGAFGKAFKRIDRPELVTNTDCYNAALAEMQRSISSIQPSNFSALMAPHLEPGDIVTIKYPDGTSELHLLDSCDYDFSDQLMQVTTRGRGLVV